MDNHYFFCSVVDELCPDLICPSDLWDYYGIVGNYFGNVRIISGIIEKILENRKFIKVSLENSRCAGIRIMPVDEKKFFMRFIFLRVCGIMYFRFGFPCQDGFERSIVIKPKRSAIIARNKKSVAKFIHSFVMSVEKEFLVEFRANTQCYPLDCWDLEE